MHTFCLGIAMTLQWSFAYNSYFANCQSYKSASKFYLTEVKDPMSSSPWSFGSTESRFLCMILYSCITLSSKSSGSSQGSPSLGSKGIIIFFPCPFNLILSFSSEIFSLIFLAQCRSTRVGYDLLPYFGSITLKSIFTDIPIIVVSIFLHNPNGSINPWSASFK